MAITVCLIVVSYKQDPDYPLIVAANRDEFYRRRAASLAWWGDGKTLAGRDLGYPTRMEGLLSMFGLRQLRAQGTWLGVNRQGRFAVVTNFREPGKESKTARSRGLLVQRYLENTISTEDFRAELESTAHLYNGYNLIFGDSESIYYFSNRSGLAAKKLEPGLYGLSNALLDTPWHKTLKAKFSIQSILENPAPERVFDIMANSEPAPDNEIQQTGLPFAIEKGLSSLFVKLPGYGTRVTSCVRFTAAGIIHFAERSYEQGKYRSEQNYSFTLQS